MERVRFLHIPKTAGSTLIAILDRQYRGAGHFSFFDGHASYIRRYQALSEENKRNLVLFTGHAPICTGIKEADDATIITLLRDPLSRVKSFCQHVSEGKSPYLKKEFPPGSFTLDHFLESGNRELSNLQTKMLIKKGRIASPALVDSMPLSEARDMALENLFGKVSFFGLQEYFDESLIVFASALNWGMPSYTPLNKKHSFGSIRFEKRHIERILALNAIDVEVYDAARERFSKLLSSDKFDGRKLKIFQRMNSIVTSPGSIKA